MTMGECPTRIAGLQRQMDVRGIDAAILTDEANVTYFAGYITEHFFLTRSRTLALIVPAAGEPLAIALSSHVRDISEQTGLRAIGYDSLRHAPIAQIGAALDDLGARHVGLELGLEQRINMTARDLDRLRRHEHAEFTDISDMVWTLRAVKSPAELSMIERACRIAEQAWARCLPRVRAGDTERDLAAHLAAEIALLGGRVAFLIVTSGIGDFYRSNGAPRDRVLRDGDFVFVDIGVRHNGYHADFNRTFVLGRPSAEQATMQALVKEVSEGAARHLVPGVTAAEVYARVLDDCRAAGLAIRPPGRIGHGVGLGVTEPPHISAEDAMVLAEGVVTTIEPMVERPDALYCAECIYAVSASGGYRLNAGGSALESAG